MHRIAKILLIAGMAILLCAPGLSLAFNGRPEKPSPCTDVAPVIDGELEAVWEDAHFEDITADIAPPSIGQLPGSASLGIMNDAENLYLALVEVWPFEVIEQQLPGSIFWVAFEDDAPEGWNSTNPDQGADEGWFFFVGTLGLTSNGEMQVKQMYPGLSVSAFVGRVGGPGSAEPAFLDDCIANVAFDPAPGTESAFAYGMADDDGDSIVFIHEVRIDLDESPLNIDPGECFRGFFAGIGQLPIDGESLTTNDVLELVDIAWDGLGQLAFGYWPNEETWDLLECCFGACVDQFPECLPGEFCDMCVSCFGGICLDACAVEVGFVPEPTTMLLFGSGLLGLAGYAGLRARMGRHR
jgi:hypothetical protein